MYRQLSERRQITLPPRLLKEVGAKPGQYFEIHAEGQRLVLVPKKVEDTGEDSYDWRALTRLVRRERKKAKSFHGGEAARRYLRQITSG